jgi:hypothetical protein
MGGNPEQWRNQTSCIGAALAVGLLFLQIRQMPWRQVLWIAPPAALVAFVAVSIAQDFIL